MHPNPARQDRDLGVFTAKKANFAAFFRATDQSRARKLVGRYIGIHTVYRTSHSSVAKTPREGVTALPGNDPKFACHTNTILYDHNKYVSPVLCEEFVDFLFFFIRGGVLFPTSNRLTDLSATQWPTSFPPSLLQGRYQGNQGRRVLLSAVFLPGRRR